MQFSFQGKDNAGVIAEIEKATGGTCVSSEHLASESNGHKFKPDQKVRLVGLEDYPEFNGEIITITNIREDGVWGKAYYFKTDNPDLASQLNWTYEYRLKGLRFS